MTVLKNILELQNLLSHPISFLKYLLVFPCNISTSIWIEVFIKLKYVVTACCLDPDCYQFDEDLSAGVETLQGKTRVHIALVILVPRFK